MYPLLKSEIRRCNIPEHVVITKLFLISVSYDYYQNTKYLEYRPLSITIVTQNNIVIVYDNTDLIINVTYKAENAHFYRAPDFTQ